MQDLIKRYFWVLGAVVVMICAVFAAKATGHILEANLLPDAKKGPKITPVARTEAPKETRTKDGAQLASRNMFCSGCTPTVATVTNTDPSQIQLTQLPLSLLATSVSPDDKSSYASVINTDSQKQGSFSVGDVLPGANGKIVAIRFKYVDFENGGKIERLVLQGATAPTTVAVAETKPPVDENKDDLQSQIDNGIKKTGDNTFEIDKSLIEKVLVNPMAVAKGARVVPAMKNGKPEGFKLYAIRPTSAFAKLGLSNGDTLTAVNGFELNSADKALEVYTKLRDATSFELEVTRRGKPLTLKYTVR